MLGTIPVLIDIIWCLLLGNFEHSKTHQFSELEIVEHVNISLLSLLLFFVHLSPNPVNGSHCQDIVGIYFPRVAVVET